MKFCEGCGIVAGNICDPRVYCGECVDKLKALVNAKAGEAKGMKAVLCPVCLGRGTVPPKDNCSVGYEVTCHGCGGTGWVMIPEEAGLDPKFLRKKE